MKDLKVSTHRSIFMAVLAGLFSTQVIGTIHVYLSNKDLHQSMQAVQKAGYLAVPNDNVWPALQELGTAFMGGLFFTLSIGAGLSVIALLGAWTWYRLLKRGKAALFFCLLLWLMGIVAVNGKGFSTLATAYIVIVPSIVFLAVIFLLRERQKQETGLYRMACLGVPIFLVLLFLPLAKKTIFVDIRDMILFNNSIGRKINIFYYEYTLYAAQAFKSLEQKTIRTCRLALAENESHRDTIAKFFVSRDYLVVGGNGPVDLKVLEQDGTLLLLAGNKTVLSKTVRELAANPSSILQQFSRQTDRFGPLRLTTFVSMMAGAPLCLYIILHGFFFMVFSIFMDQRRAGYAALLLCLLAGMAIALPLYGIKVQEANINNARDLLKSDRLQERVAALRYIAGTGAAYDQLITETQDMLTSPHIAERYWYARALGSSKSPEAGKKLLAALDDPNTNVVCMAFYGLGRQKDNTAIEPIKQRMQKSGKWYEQHYGYRALKSLGWKQTGS
jgi:hypothetical protein